MARSAATRKIRTPNAENQQYILEIVSGVVRRFALDEVLHRIGGDESGVVALRVGGPEGVAVDQHQHAGAKDRAFLAVARRD